MRHVMGVWFNRLRWLAGSVILVYSVMALGFAVLLALEQVPSQDALNERFSVSIGELARRVDLLERIDAASRMHSLENDMLEIRWTARGAAGIVVGRMVLAGMMLGYGYDPKRRKD